LEANSQLIFFRYSGYGQSADLDNLLIVFSAQFTLVSLLLLLNFLPDSAPTVYDDQYAKLNNPCPQIGASYFSKILYYWSTPLLWKGYRNPLETEDLWQVKEVTKAI